MSKPARVHGGKVLHPASGCVVGHCGCAGITSSYYKAVSKIDVAMFTKNNLNIIFEIQLVTLLFKIQLKTLVS